MKKFGIELSEYYLITYYYIPIIIIKEKIILVSKLLINQKYKIYLYQKRDHKGVKLQRNNKLRNMDNK